MTVQQIIDLGLSNAHTREAQVGAANTIIWYNKARNRVAAFIRQNVDENYFFDDFYINAVAAQTNGEYTLPVYVAGPPLVQGISEIDRVLIKGYSTDIYYTPCTEVDIRILPNDWAWYLANQPKNKPIFYLGKGVIRIAPQFATLDIGGVVANQMIKLHGQRELIDQAAGGAEADVIIPTKVHYVISEFMVPDILRARGREASAQSAENRLPGIVGEMVNTLTNRTKDDDTAKLPDETANE